MRWKPATSRHTLFAIAGLLWVVAGSLLCIRGMFWLGELEPPEALATGLAAAILAVGFYLFVFSRLVRRNIERIRLLPERPCLFAFTAVRGYLMIGLMMTAGIILRGSPIPRLYLAIPYTSMGGVLLAGGTQFFRQFIRALRPSAP